MTAGGGEEANKPPSLPDKTTRPPTVPRATAAAEGDGEEAATDVILPPRPPTNHPEPGYGHSIGSPAHI